MTTSATIQKKAKPPKVKQTKSKKSVTITVNIRPYRNDAERRSKLRLFVETLQIPTGGEAL